MGSLQFCHEDAKDLSSFSGVANPCRDLGNCAVHRWPSMLPVVHKIQHTAKARKPFIRDLVNFACDNHTQHLAAKLRKMVIRANGIRIFSDFWPCGLKFGFAAANCAIHRTAQPERHPSHNSRTWDWG